MKPVRQTITEFPSANSLAACVASLFELPIWLVPNFVMLDRWRLLSSEWVVLGGSPLPRWWARLGGWARDEGWRTLQLNARTPNTYFGHFIIGDLAIATVRSPRGGGWNHCVVANVANGQVEWDPHPDGWPEGHQLLREDISGWILFVSLK